MENEFNILATKVLAAEASAEDETRLQEMLTHDELLRAEFAELRATWTKVKEVAPLAAASEAPPAEPPKYRVKKWQAALSASRGVSADPSLVAEKPERG